MIEKSPRNCSENARIQSNPTSDSAVCRVAICAVGELFGGVERHILGLLSGFTAQGVSAFLLLFHDGELAAQAREQGVDPVILPDKNRSLLSTCRLLANILKQWKVKVVHVHGYKATVYCALARYWYSFAVLKTEHGLPETSGSGMIPTMRTRIYYLLDGIATRIAHMSVCYVTEELRTHHRCTRSGLGGRVIPNGVGEIDHNQLQYPPEFQKDWFNIVIIGRVDTVKGHQLAIEAVAAKGMPKNVHLHIVGAGPNEPALQVLAKTHLVTHRVHFLGFRRDVYNYLAHCQMLLMPSLHEGLPYTLLEAMVLGIPIIASRVGGLAEVLQDSVTALLVPPGDSQSLTQAIRRLYDDPKLRLHLVEHARHLQQEKYSLKSMTNSYLSIYCKLLTNSFSSNC